MAYYIQFDAILNSTWYGRVYGLCVYLMTGAPEGSTESGSGEAGVQTCDPWFTRHNAYPLHCKKLYSAFLAKFANV